MEKKITLPQSVNAPIAKNHKVGSVEFFSNGQSVGKCDIVAKEDIRAQNPFGMFGKISSFYLYGKK